ncbi:hypothetical protein AB0D10_16030 [Kitasatospora sp. NPDC048545]|uniref:hypothetical protein n=1 Tax=Kitasatospora sp. NPDC048545 TaxID=3157208 RepID=UPI003406C855
MQARQQPEKAGRPHRTTGPARRPATGPGAPQAVASLQRAGNAATARELAEQRGGAERDDGRAVPALQRVTGEGPGKRRVRQQVDATNVLKVCEAATFDGEAVRPGARAAALRSVVWEGHWAAISAVCRKHKYTIAVRETGEHSIRRIAEGAKAKPHTILEKSVKPSSVRKKYGTGPGQAAGDPEHILHWLQAQDLDGFVGHWDAQGLIGVRVDNPPPELLAEGIVETGDHREQYVPLTVGVGDGGPAMARLKAYPKWKQYLYTGDYDLHEVYSAQGGTNGGQIPEATPEKAKLLDRLNAGIAGKSREEVVRSGATVLQNGRLHMAADSDHAMFQHGDQATYRMNQYLEAQDAAEEQAALEGQVARQAALLVRAVATETDEPLAWCRMGQWYVTRNPQEHAALRTRWRLAVPHSWGAEEVDRTARGGYRTARYTD